jgi:hypothetical protein
VKVKVEVSQLALTGTPFTGQEDVRIEAEWGDYGRVVIRQTDPLPLEILGILPNVDIGG